MILCSGVASVLQILALDLRPCEKYLADFCTSALLKDLKINLLYSKKSICSNFQRSKSPLENFHIVSTLDHLEFCIKNHCFFLICTSYKKTYIGSLIIMLWYHKN